MQIAEDRGIVVDSIKQEEDRLYAILFIPLKLKVQEKTI